MTTPGLAEQAERMAVDVRPVDAELPVFRMSDWLALADLLEACAKELRFREETVKIELERIGRAETEVAVLRHEVRLGQAREAAMLHALEMVKHVVEPRAAATTPDMLVLKALLGTVDRALAPGAGEAMLAQLKAAEDALDEEGR